tara:strand:- start:1246 stop:2403 length:1158 start_codon:yes stop_codon:yes gene_type:complete
MESHPDTAAVESIPTEESAPADTSFFDAIENALSGAQPEDQVESQPEEQPEEQPESQPEQQQENQQVEAQENTSEIEADPLDQLSENVGDEWTPKAANRFKQLKTELKSNRSELEQLQQTVKQQEQQISEMKGLTEAEDLEQMRERIAEFERVQAVENLEETQAYVEAVSEPLDKVFGTLNDLAEKYDVDPDHILDALDHETTEEQDEKIAELFYGATDRDKVKVYKAIEEIDPILERREELHQNAEDALNEARYLEEQKKNAVAAEELKQRQAVTDNVVDRVLEKLPFLNGLDIDMEAVKEKAFTTSPDVIHPVDYAYNSVAAQLLPRIVKEYFQTLKENDSLTDRLADFESAEPNISGRAPDGSTRPSADLDFASAIEAALRA